jgi:hypothetical protein
VFDGHYKKGGDDFDSLDSFWTGIILLTAARGSSDVTDAALRPFFSRRRMWAGRRVFSKMARFLNFLGRAPDSIKNSSRVCDNLW